MKLKWVQSKSNSYCKIKSIFWVWYACYYVYSILHWIFLNFIGKTVSFLFNNVTDCVVYPQKSKSNQVFLTNYVMSCFGTKLFPCDKCEKKFRQKRDLTRHYFTHTGEKPFSCSYCDKRFARKDKLNLHVRLQCKSSV